jgi:hypothetical protein
VLDIHDHVCLLELNAYEGSLKWNLHLKGQTGANSTGQGEPLFSYPTRSDQRPEA